jgi:hypothetical protein
MTTGVPFIRNEATQHTIQKLLDENAHLIRVSLDNHLYLYFYTYTLQGINNPI